LERFIIPEPNHTKACSREIQRPLQIFDHRLGMLPTVQLDDQSRTNTHEIHDESPDRHLSSKSITAQWPMPQVKPETLLGVSRVRA